MTLRFKKTRNFTVLHNTMLDDPNLSFRAKGVLAYLLSRPDDWSIQAKQLASICKSEKGEGRDAVRTAIEEIEKAGYCRRTKTQSEKGQWMTICELSELPIFPPENPLSTPQPNPEKPSSADQALLQELSPNTNTASSTRESEKVKKEKKPPNPLHVPFKTWFLTTYRGHHGFEYTFVPRNGKDINSILEACGNDSELCKRLVKVYFADDDRFVRGHPLHLLASQIHRYLADAKKNASSAKLAVDDIANPNSPNYQPVRMNR